MPPPPGRFITLEGGEGAGKSTQSRLLAARLRAAGVPVLETREPGGAPGAERLRGLLLSGEVAWSLPAETLLHFAARAEHVERTIRPALEAGSWVVCDRFFRFDDGLPGLCARRRPGGDRRADGAARVAAGSDAGAGCRRADRHGPDAARAARRPTATSGWARGSSRRVREGFLAVAAAEPERCVLVGASDTSDAVAAQVWRAVRDGWAGVGR